MVELIRCFDLAQLIQEVDRDIMEVKFSELSPKNQVITDMPKGGSVINPIESYIIRMERLEKRKECLCNDLNIMWGAALAKLKSVGIIEETTIVMLMLRFKNGCSWDKCANTMDSIYPNANWNSNKCFRVYRSVLNKTKCL